MKKYHTEDSASSLIQSPWLPRYVWVNPVPPPFTHSRVVHERDSEPSHSLSAPAVPAWCVPLRTAQFPTLHISLSALRICPNVRTAAWNYSSNFTTQYVSRLDDGRSVTGRVGGVEVQQDQGRVVAPPPHEQLEQGATADACSVAEWPGARIT